MTRFHPRPVSTQIPMVGGLVCLGISVIMSMTLYEPNWQNNGSVVVVLALMVLAGVAGLALILRAAAASTRATRLGGVALDLGDEVLRAGSAATFELEVDPGGVVVLDEVEVALEMTEHARVEGGSMEERVAVVHADSAAFPVGEELEPGEPFTLAGELPLPESLPATFAAAHHDVAMIARVTLRGSDLGEMVRLFDLPVRGAAAPAREAGEDATAELYTGEVGGLTARLSVDAPVGEGGIHEVATGAEVRGAVTFEAAGGGAVPADLLVDLVWMVDGGFLDVHSVAASDPLGEGAVPADGSLTREFVLAVPADAVPTWKGEVVEVSWGLRLTADRAEDPGEVEYFPVRVLQSSG